MELTETEVRILIDKIGPHIDSRYDHTYGSWYPEGRKDVAVVKRLAENGSTFGFDTIYFVWKMRDGEVGSRELLNSRATKDYLNIRTVIVEGETLKIKIDTGGSMSGQAQEWEFEQSLPALGLA